MIATKIYGKPVNELTPEELAQMQRSGKVVQGGGGKDLFLLMELQIIKVQRQLARFMLSLMFPRIAS